MNRDIPGYDLWKLDTPDNHVKVVGECVYCSKDVYQTEHKVELSEGLYHSECLWELEDEKHYGALEREEFYMILYYDVWIETYARGYMEDLHIKASEGKLDLKKFDRVATKLTEWEDHYIEQFGQKCKSKYYLKN